MNSWKVIFLSSSLRLIKFRFMLLSRGICSETGLKYDLDTRNDVGMHIKSQIEKIKQNQATFCRSIVSQLRLNFG